MKTLFFSFFLLINSSMAAAHFDGFENQLGIELLKESSAYRFDIPAEVYQSVYNSSLSDVRIINATGDYIPMRISINDDKIKLKYTQTSLPIFKMNQIVSTDRVIPSTTQQVRKTKTGEIENYTVTTSQSLSHYMQMAEVQRDNVFYIDASVVADSNVTSLSLDWHYQTMGNRIFSVDILGSNDLLNWVVIKNNHKLIEVNTGSRKLLENTIQFGNRSFKFYQLKFNDAIVPEILAVKAHLFSQKSESQMQWLSIDDFTKHNSNEIIIDTGGFFPLEALDIQFNQRNTVTDVKISSSRKLNKWRQSNIEVNTLYDITTDGINMKKNTIRVSRNSHRYWKLKFDDNVNNKNIKSIKIGWRIQGIEFLAQGEAPFTLLFGDSKINIPAPIKWYHRLPNKKGLFSDQVKLSKSINLSHSKHAKKNDIKETTDMMNLGANKAKWLFWVILIIVIVVLFYMAFKLVNGDMRINNDNENT